MKTFLLMILAMGSALVSHAVTIPPVTEPPITEPPVTPVVWAEQNGVAVYTNQVHWETVVATSPGRSIDRLATTAENLILANEVSTLPVANEDLGPNLTFETAVTGFDVTFKLWASQSGSEFVFNDDSEGGVWADALSVGNINSKENDNFYINVLSNDLVSALSFELRDNTSESTEQLRIRCGTTDLALFDASSLPSSGGTSQFIGIVSSTPFDEVWFDEYSGGDDMAMANPQLVYIGVVGGNGHTGGGYQITIHGLNLGNGSDITSVTVCGVSVESIDSQSANQVVVTVAPGTAGTGDVVVESTSQGTTTKTDAFTYYDITSPSGSVAGGNTIRISAITLGNGSDISSVTVGGVAATITGQGADWVEIILPSGSEGTKDILVSSTSQGSTPLSSAYTYKPAGLIFGSRWDASMSLSALDGTNGFRLDGIDASDLSGYSVSGAGDVNGDGFADLIIGAYLADPNGNLSAGASYVVFGSDAGFDASMSLSTLDGTNGFRLDGIDGSDHSGFSVSGAGDVNGDGIDDLIIGAKNATPNENHAAGKSYVVFGSDAGFDASMSLSALDGSNGFRLDGIDTDDNSGRSVSGAGDVNGDGFADLIIGAAAAPNGLHRAGESYVVFGADIGFDASIPLSTLDGTNGFRIDGIAGSDDSGFSVSGAGDVNGDGFSDLIIGAHGADLNGNFSVGESYVVFGSDAGFDASMSLSALDGTNGFLLDGIDAFDESGYSVSGAGDVNGDGFSDLIIGAHSAGVNGNSSVGESYVVFGSDAGFDASMSLSALDGTNGFLLDGIDEFDHSGISVSGAGDVNGDGFDDFIIGAMGADLNGNREAGESYVVFGSDGGFSASMSLSSLDGINGFRLDGIVALDSSGRSVSGAGDVNGDGIDDLIIGAGYADPNGNDSAGESYVVFGKDRSVKMTGPTSGGYQITVNGENLGNGSDITNVTVCGVSVTSIDSQSANQVVVTVAPGPVGTGDVVVYSANQGTTTKTDAFTYYDITSTSGSVAGGNTITISGALFGNGSDITGVTVGGVAATITGQGAAWVEIILPSGSEGTKDIVVSSTSQGSTALSNAYTYKPAGLIFGSGFDASMSLSALDGINGFSIGGIDRFGGSGFSVNGGGDVNGDGFADLIIGAYRAAPNGNNSAGKSYVVFGSDAGFDALVSLSALDGTNGFRLDGIDEEDFSGYSVSDAGDVNGDGFSDLIIGAYQADPNGNNKAGKSYVVFGSDAGFDASMSLSALDGTNGFRLDGIDANDLSGYSVSGAGDVNGDGLSDLIIGAHKARPNGKNGSGESYVVFGSDVGFDASISLATINGTNGFRIDGVNSGDYSGCSVSGAGDVNGDGLSDLIIGARRADPNGITSAGESYVVFGSDAGFEASMLLSTLDGTNGFRLEGIDANDSSGESVSGAGDVNGDGYDDVVIGARLADPNGNADAGESYVVFGSGAGLDASVSLRTLDGTNGFRIDGIYAVDHSGYSVSGAGDVNGDGFADLIIGTSLPDPNGIDGAGQSYVIFGSDMGFDASMSLSTLDGANGFRLDGINRDDYSGRSVSGAGDVNGDGIDDLIIGAYQADPNGNLNAGESYVVFGAISVKGVVESTGSTSGGYQITVNGENLGNGSDITNVTVCGVSVTSIDSQSANQVVVTVAPGPAGIGDIVVHSANQGSTTKTDAFTYVAPTNPDTDGDGIPDAWEDLYGIGSAVSNQTADADGDGFSNWKEYVWDTVPTDSNQYFRISITGSGVGFPSSSNRYYTLQFRTNLLSGSWQDVADQIVVKGNGATNALDHTRRTTNGFYRVNVQVEANP